MHDYSRDLRLAKWGSGVKLHGNNLELSMSALGQKRTLKRLRPMFALPPKADIETQSHDVRFVPSRMLKVLRNKDRKAESDRRERQMSYLSNVLTERPMLRVTASVILAFCCAAPLVWLFSNLVYSLRSYL
jgi:hypothetical protein